ncbi:MAG: M3 family oligoendopeptidase [Candidatus Heimdallarchaeota archaeon]
MSSAKGVMWDLSFFYEGLDDHRIDEHLTKADGLANEIVNSYRKKIKEASAEDLANMLREYEEFIETIAKPQLYVYLRFTADNLDQDVQSLLSRIEKQVTETTNKLVFIDLEINEIDDGRFNDLLANEVLSDYRHYLELVRLQKPYLLTEEAEQVLQKKALTSIKGWAKFYEEFTSSLEFEIEIEGEKKTLTDPQMRNLFQSPDRALREQVFKTYYSVYEQNRLIWKHIFNNVFADHTSSEELRGYEEPMVPAFLRDQIPSGDRKIVKLLMDVTRKNNSILQEFFQLKAQILGFKLQGWDTLAPYPLPEKIYLWEKGKKMVLDAYSEFSQEMGAVAQKFFDEGWVDAEARKGKRGGAACWSGTPKIHPWFFLTYEEKLTNVATIAHEMGHGIHGYLAGQSQNYYNKLTPTILAETASGFGEMLVVDRLLKELTNKEEKKKLLLDQLDDFHVTVFRQVLYTLWELDVHEQGKKGALSDDELMEAWVKQTDWFYGKEVEYPEVMNWAFFAIPHFMNYLYYCYSYSFGHLFVVSLFQKYLEEGETFVPKYLALLKAGGKDFPVNLAKEIDVDLTSETFWQGGFDFFKSLIEELRALVEE